MAVSLEDKLFADTQTMNGNLFVKEGAVSWNTSRISNSEALAPDRPQFVGFEVNFVARVFFILVGSAEILSGVVGNFLLLAVIFRRRHTRVRSGHEYFIGNLALCDLLTQGYWMTYFVLDLYLGYHPVVNMAHCKVNAFVIAVCFVGTAISLTSITLNRYLYVCHDSLYCRIFSLRTTIAWCLMVWVLSAAIITPPLVGVGSYHYNPSGHFCSFNRQDPNPYARIVVMLCSLLPMFFVGYWNFAIYRFWKTARGKLKGEKMKGKRRGGLCPFSATAPSTQLRGGCSGTKGYETDSRLDHETAGDNVNDSDFSQQEKSEEKLADQTDEASSGTEDAETSPDIQEDIQQRNTELHTGGDLQSQYTVNVSEETNYKDEEQSEQDQQDSNKDQEETATEVDITEKTISLPVQKASKKLFARINRKQHESASGKPFIRKNEKQQEVSSEREEPSTKTQEMTLADSTFEVKTRTLPVHTASNKLFTRLEKKPQKKSYRKQKTLKTITLPVHTASKQFFTRGNETQEEIDFEQISNVEKDYMMGNDELCEEESSSTETDDDSSPDSEKSFSEVDIKPKTQPISAQFVARRLLYKSSRKIKTGGGQKIFGLNSARAKLAPNLDQGSFVLQPLDTEREGKDQEKGMREKEGSMLKRIHRKTNREDSPPNRFHRGDAIEEKEGSVLSQFRKEQKKGKRGGFLLKRFRRRQQKEDSPLEDCVSLSREDWQGEHIVVKRPNRKQGTEDSPLKRLQRKQKSKQSKEEAFVRSLRVVFLMMVIAFLPYGVSIIAQTFTPLPTEIAIAANLFLFSNNAVNWIVYGAMNPSFRRGYAKTLRCLFRPFTRAFSRPAADGDTGVSSTPLTTSPMHSTTVACSSNQSDTE